MTAKDDIPLFSNSQINNMTHTDFAKKHLDILADIPSSTQRERPKPPPRTYSKHPKPQGGNNPWLMYN